MTVATPYVSRAMDIEKDWIDYNGHLNMAYYNVLFDRGSDEAFELMGMGPRYAKERRLTIYTAEVHICYQQELHFGDKVTVSFQLLDHDEKRLRMYQEIRHIDGWLAATSETLSLHVDMNGQIVALRLTSPQSEAMRARPCRCPLERAPALAINRRPKTV